MTAIPIDVCAVTFTLLDMDDLLQASQVCKGWREHINTTPSLWQHAHFHYEPYESYSDFSGKRILFRHRPNATLVEGRLQGRKLQSLFITANINVPEYTINYPSRPDARIQPYITATLGALYRGEEREPLHLRLEGFHGKTMIATVLSIGETRSTTHLDLLTEGEQSAGDYLAISILCDVKFLRICPSGEEPLPFPDGVPNPLTNSPTVVSDSVNEGLVSLCLSVKQPVLSDCAGDGCTELWPSKLEITEGLRFLHLRKGKWDITNAESSVLEILICDQLWGLSRKWSNLELYCFKNLVRFHLSFLESIDDQDTVNPIQWTDLITIICCTIGPTLQVLYLHVPSRIGGRQHREYDDVWADRIEHARSLRDLTLVEYFPSTLKYLGCEGSKSIPPLQKFTLIGYQVYDDMLFSCHPETLPDLKIFDLSATSFHKGVAASKRENWVREWESVTSVDFRRPSSVEEVIDCKGTP